MWRCVWSSGRRGCNTDLSLQPLSPVSQLHTLLFMPPTLLFKFLQQGLDWEEGLEEKRWRLIIYWCYLRISFIIIIILKVSLGIKCLLSGSSQMPALLCGTCSVAQSRLILCDPMDCSTPGFPVLRYPLELAQALVHWVSDAIQPSRPLSSPSPAFSLSQLRGLF